MLLSVLGVRISQHRIVLAARSPVFRAELYGPMQEARLELITIEDTQPAVFKAMMHFIYTDSLPETDDRIDANLEMIRHLLVAADKYALDRLHVGMPKHPLQEP
jgi:speckle-type POZ protein